MKHIQQPVAASIVHLVQVFDRFCFEKEGCETKKRTTEDEIEEGDCGPPTLSVVVRYYRT